MAIRVGVSACVLGDRVRFDGGHKLSHFVAEELARVFRFVPICPEQAIGMGVPRPSVRLVGDPARPRVKGCQQPDLDVTDRLLAFGRRALPSLAQLSGYVLCGKSPSCGMARVRVYKENGDGLGKVGVGVFARQLMATYPNLPVEEDGRLQDPLLRENFVLRVLAYHQWQSLLAQGLSHQVLQDFHRRHKFLLLAHHQQAYRQLGPLLAAGKGQDLQALADDYIRRFMAALKKPASRCNHSNVLMHLQGFFKQQLTSLEKAELTELIGQYRQGLVPLMAPLTLLNHHLRRHPKPYLAEQRYLSPYPMELKLRYGL
ncbi:DUF523 and DUF1722 domain-containing protein [Gallaecimonas sp. GXIMD4217]|uniref:YbgA family protein n=1 Tax=Gallaecimonas sp. GXIMD4217 TaxID=3131927 RepID=UPI00311AD6D4